MNIIIGGEASKFARKKVKSTGTNANVHKYIYVVLLRLEELSIRKINILSVLYTMATIRNSNVMLSDNVGTIPILESISGC